MFNSTLKKNLHAAINDLSKVIEKRLDEFFRPDHPADEEPEADGDEAPREDRNYCPYDPVHAADTSRCLLSHYARTSRRRSWGFTEVLAAFSRTFCRSRTRARP